MTRQGALLVVDDNENNRDVLSRRLRQKGYAVEVAADGAEALARIRAESYDLILLDVEMPGMSGLEVLTQVRLRRSQTQLPVIMVTARSEGADIVEAFGLGANDYVTKPVDFAVALARIRTHLAHKWAVEDLHESEERYALAMRGANDGLWDWNLQTNEAYWSPRWKAMLGHDEDEIGVSPDEWFNRVHDEDVERVKGALFAHLADGTAHYESEHRILHSNGTYRWVLCRGAAVRDSAGTATRLAGSLTDITESKLADALTGLPNRLLFLDLVERAIRREKRRPNPAFALLSLGLNRFNVVSDSLGPLTADRLLVAVARRLQSSLRPTDTVARDEPSPTLARLGGDEFNVLLDDIKDPTDAMRVAELQLHRGEVRRRRDAAVRDRQRPRPRPRLGQHLRHAARRRARMRQQQQRRRHRQPQRGEVALRVERQARAEQRGVDHQRVVRRADRVAVRRRGRHRLGPGDGGAAAAVLDEEGLAGDLRRPLRQDARDDVAAAARPVGHDDAHRALGEAAALRPRRTRIEWAASTGFRCQATRS